MSDQMPSDGTGFDATGFDANGFEAAGAPSITIDTDQVSQVVDFYQQTSQVLGATSEQLRSHRFGTWVIGEEYRELGERFVTMSEVIADRLAEQAVAAARLSDELIRSVHIVTAADADAAEIVQAALPESS